MATRITAAQAAAPFVPSDVIAATAIPLGGAAGNGPRRLVLDVSSSDAALAIPPLPGQAIRIAPNAAGASPAPVRIELELSPRLRGDLPPQRTGTDRTRDVLALVARVRRRITPDLAARPGSAHGAASATAGDCTTFALAYAALATARGIPTRVVTGFRVDGDRLVRHRWAISWTGGAWIAVDAAFGAAPAGGDLVGLVVHAADDISLLTGEAALIRVRGAAWRSPD